MQRLIRYFRDRHKRLKRPKRKDRPPGCPQCDSIRFQRILDKTYCDLYAIDYLDSLLVRTEYPSTTESKTNWLVVHAITCFFTEGGPMYDDEPPLEGEYLRAICIALSRNALRGLREAAIVLDAQDRTTLKKPPQSERSRNFPMIAKGD